MSDNTGESCDWVPWVAGVFGVAGFVAVLFIVRWYLQGRKFSSKVRMDGKVVIITGCNTGIGQATALDLAGRGAKVYMACRDFARCEAARLDIVEQSGNPNVINCTLDLASLGSIREFVEKFLATEERLDVLINNAAIYPKKRECTADGFESQLGVNHLGPFLLTNMLLDVLKESAPSRIIMVSSAFHAMGSINKEDFHTDDFKEDTSSYNSMRTYCMTKLANVIFARSLAMRLNGTGVTANSLHPGVVRTEITRHLTWERIILFVLTFFYKSPKAGAQTQIRLAADPDLMSVSGKYFSDCRIKECSTRAKDVELADWLWAKSKEMTNLIEKCSL